MNMAALLESARKPITAKAYDRLMMAAPMAYFSEPWLRATVPIVIRFYQCYSFAYPFLAAFWLFPRNHISSNSDTSITWYNASEIICASIPGLIIMGFIEYLNHKMQQAEDAKQAEADARFEERIENMINRMLTAFEERMEKKIDEKLAAFEERMEKKIDEKLAAFEERMEKKIDEKLAAFEERIEEIIDQKIDKRLESLGLVPDQDYDQILTLDGIRRRNKHAAQ